MRITIGRPVSMLGRIAAWFRTPRRPVEVCSRCHAPLENQTDGSSVRDAVICTTPGGVDFAAPGDPPRIRCARLHTYAM